MDTRPNNSTRILFVDADERYFEFKKCIARVIADIPPVEMYHANDATEALRMMDEVKPDVIVLDDSVIEECDLFLDSLNQQHPPIVFQTEASKPELANDGEVSMTYLQKDESLAGIHQSLMQIAAVAQAAIIEQPLSQFH